MDDSDRNDTWDSRDQSALIIGGIVAVIIASLVLSFIQPDSREPFDIWMTILIFSVVSIATFAISFTLIRYILKGNTSRKTKAHHYIMSMLSYPLRQSLPVKGIIALGIACTGVVLYIFYYGQQPISIIVCSLFGIPLVAFLNNTFGRRRNEMVAVTIYFTIIFLIFFIRYYVLSVIANDYSRLESWAWLLMVILIPVCFFLLFYQNLFSLTDEEQKDTLERRLIVNIPCDQVFDRCLYILQQVFLGKITSSDSIKGRIDLQTPLSHFTLIVEKIENRKSRITIQRITSRYTQLSGFIKKWHIRTLQHICESIRKLETVSQENEELPAE